MKAADTITGSEIKIMGITAKYNWMDCKRKEDFLKNEKQSLYWATCQNIKVNCVQHVDRM
jgi:hypothetical protein